MKKRITARLRSKAGESIAETLVALLISALALVMLAGAISSAARIIKESNVAAENMYNNAGQPDSTWLGIVQGPIQNWSN